MSIKVVDEYLKDFITKEEYECMIEALNDAYARQPEERFLKARRKLSAQEKEEFGERIFRTDLEDLLLHESSLILPGSAMDKLRIIGACIRSSIILEIEYEENGKRCPKKIEPHLLLFQEDSWYVYAFCHLKRNFQLFALSHIYTIRQTEENFKKRPFERSDVPTATNTRELPVRLEISKSALPSVKKWLGVENLKQKNGKWFADVSLQNNEQLTRKLLSFGSGIKIISPIELKRKIKSEGEKLAKLYTKEK